MTTAAKLQNKNGIHLESKYEKQCKKCQSHRLKKLIFEFQAFHSIFLQIFPVISTKSIYIFLISVFAICNIISLNLFHKNFDETLTILTIKLPQQRFRY